ncbi:HEPN domain-containing protein [Vibrio lentus]
MNPSISSFKNSMDNIISSLDYTINKLEIYEEISSRKVKKGKKESKLAKKTDVFITSFVGSCARDYGKFIYNGSLVSIYGSLERLVEDLIEACIHNISLSTGDYEKLNNSIKKNHIEFSLNYASRITKDRNLEQSQKLKKQKEVIDNLQSCFNNLANFTLNKHAFSVHTANFRYDIIRESFSNIGISNILIEMITNDESIRKVIINDLGLSPSEKIENTQLDNHLREKLDELAIRRNQIAHGARPESYLNYELLLNFAQFIYVFGVSLHNYCSAYIDKYKLEHYDFSSNDFIHLGMPTKTFSNHKSIGIEVKNDQGITGKTIKSGDDIFLVNRNSPTVIKKDCIKSMFINNTKVKEHKITGAFEIGIEIDTQILDSLKRRNVYVKSST